MPGYIDNTTNESLFEGYSSGRSEWKSDIRLSGSGQWSAVNDDRICDFCSWADDQIFAMDQVEWDPPVHWGCRCLVGYILKEEKPGPSTWGKGPPKNTFPPGTRKVKRSASKQSERAVASPKLKPEVKPKKPKLTSADLDRILGTKTTPKPKPKPKPRPRPKPKPKPKPVGVKTNTGRSVGTKWTVDRLKDKDAIERFLRGKYDMKVELDGMSLASARRVARAMEKFVNAYPELRKSLNQLFTDKSKLGTFELKSAIAPSGGANGITSLKTGTNIPTRVGMKSQAIKITNKPTVNGFVTEGGQEGVMWHELGHVVENWMVSSPHGQNWLREIQSTIYKNSKTLMEVDVSKYATESSSEFFAEFFHIVNRKGGINAWTNKEGARKRLRETLKYFQDKGLPIAETQP